MLRLTLVSPRRCSSKMRMGRLRIFTPTDELLFAGHPSWARPGYFRGKASGPDAVPAGGRGSCPGRKTV